MSLRLAARIARRELRGGVKGFSVFLACLALGVAAIAAVGTVRNSIEAGLARKNSLVKILGNGELKTKLNVKAHAFSKSAIVAIEAMKGTAEVI